MRVAVTGARGLLGRAVVDLLVNEGHSVVALDRVKPTDVLPAAVHQVVADTTDYEQLHDALLDCAAAIHLAAYTNPYVAPVHAVHNDNVASSYNVLAAAQALGIGVVCQASSVNAIGCHFSEAPRYDYFPLDERHSTYAEDAYGLSKYICEVQGNAIARANPHMRIASLRLHALVADRDAVFARRSDRPDGDVKGLWGYTTVTDAARACLLSLAASYTGHEAFYIVARQTASALTSPELHQKYYPDVPLKAPLHGNDGFYDLSKAEQLLAWKPLG